MVNLFFKKFKKQKIFKNRFINADCFASHKMGPCQKFKKCKDCKTVYRTIKEHLHTCGERYCNLCQRWHVSTKECFIQPVIKKHGFYSYKRILVFDLEVCFF